jgi:hypothetical protein
MVDRCLHPGTRLCPAISGLLCVTTVSGIDFEYPHKGSIARDGTTGLIVLRPERRERKRTQRFVKSVLTALEQFIANSSRVGLPIEAIITYGSLYCRCVSKTDTPSNHSYGDAIDIVGVRWPPVGGPASKVRETIVYNWQDREQLALLRRLNACLRLSFPTVIDYHRPDHRDHFHCDMNRGQGATPRQRSTLLFVQEALSVTLRRSIPRTGKLDRATVQALEQFSGRALGARPDMTQLIQVERTLFERFAAGPGR